MIRKYLIKISIIFVTIIILFSSILNLYDKRENFFGKLDQMIHDGVPRYLVNPLKKSEKQIPPDTLDNLIIDDTAQIDGLWSAPIDWNVTAIHSVLLPDYSVMTFGTFGIEEKEDGDIQGNKKITLTSGLTIDRDAGNHQWIDHNINSGVDFDIWNQEDGFKDETHQLFKTPVVMDAFCSVVRVLDLDRVFILGGNKNIDTDLPDTQNSTMIYNVKSRKFESSQNMNFKRWYGSAVITGDNKMLMLGGVDVIGGSESIIPEIIDLKNINKGWSNLDKAKSEDLFGRTDGHEWSYPKAFLASDGNIVGISYNKIWVMDSDDDFRITKTAEIPLVKSGISRIVEHKKGKDTHGVESTERLKLLTIGQGVGRSSTAVMIDQDKVIIFGGLQEGAAYSPSNKVHLIDFSDSFKPVVTEINSMNFSRSYGDSTILPNGKVFLNGGHSYNDLEFSNFIPEIYDTNTGVSTKMKNSYFRRNYHSSSLLLPNGTILTAGGDVWNAEVFYPPYLFTKNIKNETILTERTEIINLKNNIKRGESSIFSVSGNDVSRVTLISTGSKTHSQGSESKFRELNFKKMKNNKIEINLTSNSNAIQNGTYMLFAINSKGVPSNGKIVYID